MTAHMTRRPGCWELLAEELMTENPHSIREDASVEDAIAFLTDKGYRAAPVIDESGRPVGVISQSDILIHDRQTCGGGLHDFYGMGSLDFENLPVEGKRDVRVRDLMTPVVFQVPPDAPFSGVLEEMVTLNVHRLFVVSDDGILIGVITALDVLRRLYEEARREAVMT